MNPPRIAFTAGDPNGIGAEVLLRTLKANHPELFEPVVYGPRDALDRAAELVGVEPPEARECGGALPEVEALEAAVADCLSGACDGLVTAPIHKQRLMDAGFPFVGHTEFLANRCGRDGQVVMAFGGGRLRVALLTTHLPLAKVADAITAAEVERVARIFDDGLRRFFGHEQPRMALCGLNPHAGEGGRLGHEDGEILAPGVEAVRAAGIDLVGPLPADTAFPRALRGDFDGVIACYHNQGLSAVKSVDFGRSVNMTLGLPFVRTSPDHGTAYDIAWTGRADPSSMIAATRMAVRCVSSGGGKG